MAKHLLAMAEAFESKPKPRIPHTDGRAFEGLVEQLEEFFVPYLEKGKSGNLSHFRYAIAQATRLDESLYKFADYEELDEETRREFDGWARDARRLSADLMLAARRIEEGGKLKFDDVLRARVKSSHA